MQQALAFQLRHQPPHVPKLDDLARRGRFEPRDRARVIRAFDALASDDPAATVEMVYAVFAQAGAPWEKEP